MRLLICTQKVDRNDSVLGFFHRWLEEFAKHCDSVLVLCLEKGEYSLPENVHVYSLGKDKGANRLRIAYNFLLNIFVRRTEYDAVFVHMNPEYIALGGLLWRYILKKRIVLWYNHPRGSILLRIFHRLPSRILHTSPFAYSSRYKNAEKAPAGIDTDLFKRKEGEVPAPNTILFLGRISPVKHVAEFIEALIELDRRGVDFKASIVGDVPKIDAAYGAAMRTLAAPLEQKGKVTWSPGVPHEKTRDLYVSHQIYVNLTPTGSFDKTILEAMACGAMPIVCNVAYGNILPSWAIVGHSTIPSIADALVAGLTSKTDILVRQYVEREQKIEHTISVVNVALKNEDKQF